MHDSTCCFIFSYSNVSPPLPGRWTDGPLSRDFPCFPTLSEMKHRHAAFSFLSSLTMGQTSQFICKLAHTELLLSSCLPWNLCKIPSFLHCFCTSSFVVALQNLGLVSWNVSAWKHEIAFCWLWRMLMNVSKPRELRLSIPTSCFGTWFSF